MIRLSYEVDRLELKIQTGAEGALQALEGLEAKLGGVSQALSQLNIGGLNEYSRALGTFSTALVGLKTLDGRTVNSIVNQITKLGSIDTSRMSSVSANIKALSQSFDTIPGIEKMATLSVSLREMAQAVGKFGLKSASNAVQNLPNLTRALREFLDTMATARAVPENITATVQALANLAAVGSRVNSTYNSMTRFINSATGATERHTHAMNRSASASGGLASQFRKLLGAYFTFRYVGGYIWRSVESAMDFGETINLFETAFRKIGLEMGKSMEFHFLDRAYDFNKRFTDALTLDPDAVMNYQARFAQMSNSMGVLPETAMNISNIFTALGADIASLFNLDIPEAMQKLQSGLAGQIRPLRDLGVDISRMSLEVTALNYGLTETFAEMDQGTKVQLRTLTTLEQMRVAIGDMGRTIHEPANQLRVLRMQLTMTGRSLGQIFLPVVSKILPWVNGLAIAIGRVLRALASLFGYEVPDFRSQPIFTGDAYLDIEEYGDDFDDLAGSVGNVGSGLGSAADNAKKLQSVLAGFDRLNILKFTEPSTSGGSGGGGGGGGRAGGGSVSGGGSPILDAAIADEWKKYESALEQVFGDIDNKANDIADSILKAFKPLQPFFEGMGMVLGGVWDGMKWTWYNIIQPALSGIGDFLKKHPNIAEGLGKAAGAWLTISLAMKPIMAVLNLLKIPTVLAGLGKLTGLGGAGAAGAGAAGTGILAPSLGLAGAMFGLNILLDELFGDPDDEEGLVEKLLRLNPLGTGGGTGIGTVPSLLMQSERGKRTTHKSDVPGIDMDFGGAGKSIDGPGMNLSKIKKSLEESSKLVLQSRGYIDEHGQFVATNYPRAIGQGTSSATNSWKDYSKETSTALNQADREVRSKSSSMSGSVKSSSTVMKNEFARSVAQMPIDARREMGYLVPTAREKLDAMNRTMVSTTATGFENVAREVTRGVGKAAGNLDVLRVKSGEIGTSAGESLKKNLQSRIANMSPVVDVAVKGAQPAFTRLVGATSKAGTDAGVGMKTNLGTGIDGLSMAFSSWSGQMSTAAFRAGSGLDSEFSYGSSSWLGLLRSRLSSGYANMVSYVRALGRIFSGSWSPSYYSNEYYTPPVSKSPRPAVISKFATGGFPNKGEFYFANENGVSELIGRVGNQPAVANNDQIVKAVSAGVAAAVAKVLGDQGAEGSKQPLIINVGGERFVDTVIDMTNRRSRLAGETVLNLT